jgi:predicted membrane protein
MYKKQLVIFIILLCFFTAAIQVEAAQFEGSNIKLLKETTSLSEKNANQTVSTQTNATSLNETPSIKLNYLANLNVHVASDVYSEKDRQILYCPKGTVSMAGPKCAKK